MFDAALVFAFLSAGVATVPPPPPVFDASGPSGRQIQLLSWSPGEAVCDGVAVTGTAVRPAVDIGIFDPQYVRAVSYRFAIDARGRTRSITRDADARRAFEMPTFGPDTGPALAASRFAPGAKRENCRIEYVPKIDPIATAPIADLVAYSINPTGRRLPQEGWDRFGAAGNCRNKPRPAPLLRASPDFAKVTATRGARDWSLVAYDTDAEGRPVDARIAHSTGNDELDAAAVDAVRASRFTGGARKGCLYPYWRGAATVAAPERPDEEQLRPAGAVCPAKVEWATRPVANNYPPAYRKRAIEGWAILSFDVAPWGEVGNVKPLAAEPSADFGQYAVPILRSGRVAPSAQGASGCIDTVIFMMPAEKDVAPADNGAVQDGEQSPAD